MRLIDAEKLRHELIMGHDLVGAKYTDMADTVKAIPIEWIKRWNGEMPYSENIIFVKSLDVRQLLEDWEKENECRGTD